MRRLTEMSLGDLQDFVTKKAACSDAPLGVIIPSSESPKLAEEARHDQAAAYCCRCMVRSACLELGMRQSAFARDDMVYGGYHFFGKQVVDLLNGEGVSKRQFTKDNPPRRES